MITEEFGCLSFILFKLRIPEKDQDLNHKNKLFQYQIFLNNWKLFSLPKCVILEFILN